jgi:nitrile hydratase beta subunit
MHGFGLVAPERDELYFHEPWEARMFGLEQAVTYPDGMTSDIFRFQRENMPPVEYLTRTYYEHWYYIVVSLLLRAGQITREELRTGRADASAVRRSDAMQAGAVATAFRESGKSSRAVLNSPRFIVGQPVVTRNLNSEGHTRLPRYARGKRGSIHAWRGAHVFADASARGDGEQPEHLYCVGIPARVLWGEDASARDVVFLDLWESYLVVG